MQTSEIKLAARLDLGSAAALQRELIEAMACDTVIDGKDVAVVDTSCLQLLCAFVLAATSAGSRVSWLDASPVLLEGARRLGVAATLGLGTSASQD